MATKHMDNADCPEVLAVVPLPTPQERRRREVMLARVMLVAIDIVLAGDPLRLETGRDLIREVEHTFPELAAQRGKLFQNEQRVVTSCDRECLSLAP